MGKFAGLVCLWRNHNIIAYQQPNSWEILIFVCLPKGVSLLLNEGNTMNVIQIVPSQLDLCTSWFQQTWLAYPNWWLAGSWVTCPLVMAGLFHLPVASCRKCGLCRSVSLYLNMCWNVSNQRKKKNLKINWWVPKEVGGRGVGSMPLLSRSYPKIWHFGLSGRASPHWVWVNNYEFIIYQE